MRRERAMFKPNYTADLEFNDSLSLGGKNSQESKIGGRENSKSQYYESMKKIADFEEAELLSAKQKDADDDINELRRKYRDMMHKETIKAKIQEEKLTIDSFDIGFWIILIFFTGGFGLIFMPLYIWGKIYRMKNPWIFADENKMMADIELIWENLKRNSARHK